MKPRLRGSAGSGLVLALLALGPSAGWALEIVTSDSLASGYPVNATLTLRPPRLGHDLTVKLTSSSPKLLTVPATVVVPAGRLEAGFQYQTRPVSAPVRVEITARHDENPFTERKSVLLLPATPCRVDVKPSTMESPTLAVGTVWLAGSAPPGGLVVRLSTSPDSPFRPAVDNVTIPEGKNSATFPITPTGRTATWIRASANDKEIAGKLVVGAPGIERIDGVPDTVVAGDNIFCRILLEGLAPEGGAIVGLRDGGPVLRQVVIPSQAGFAELNIKAPSVTGPATLAIMASLQGTEVTQTTVVRPIRILRLEPSGRRMQSGGVLTMTVTLERPAPPGGITVKLSTPPDPFGAEPIVLSSPTVLVPAGSATQIFDIRSRRVVVKARSWVQASLGDGSRTAHVEVSP